MSEPIIVVDSSEIREGKLEELKAALKELVEFVEANEADTLAYNIHFDETGTRMTVVQIHPSSASMEFHMEVAGPVFRRLTDLLTLSRVDFYGKPSDRLLDQMRHKARMLGNAPVVVNELHAGFARLAVANRDGDRPVMHR
jgi:quinol monooxygenase YgiN